ncbi:unannotated protein [freshwater metagenome]|uniref:Unannotated protein n=1 Tax=freshwater metagenome TaxID=449393 RepID=A0A6J7H116_9ZZZZ
MPDDVIEGRADDRQRADLLHQVVAHLQSLLAQHGTAFLVAHGLRAGLAPIVDEGLHLADREGRHEVVHQELARGELDVEVGALLGTQAGKGAVEHRLRGRDELHHHAVTAGKVLGDRGDQRWELHPDQELAEEPLLGRLEDRQRGGLGPAVVGILREAVGDARRIEGGAQVGVDDRPCIGIGVVHRDLVDRELMLQDVVLDAGEAQRARGVEPLHLEIARDQLQRRDPAPAQAFHERLAVGEGRARPPQPEACGVGEIVHVRCARGGDVEDAGAGKEVLQADAGDPLVGPVLGAEAAFAAGDTRHLVRLVEHDHAVEAVPQPVEDLAKPCAFVAAVGAQRRIGEEEYALAGADGYPELPLVEVLDVECEAAHRGPVTARILQQRLGLGDPDVLATAAEPLVEDDRGDLAAFAGAGAVGEEEAGSVGLARVVRRQGQALFGGQEPAREIALESIAGVDQRLELGVRQDLAVDDVGRKLRPVARPRRGDRAHGNRFHQRRRVLRRAPDRDPARPIGQVDAHGLLHGRRLGHDGIVDVAGGIGHALARGRCREAAPCRESAEERAGGGAHGARYRRGSGRRGRLDGGDVGEGGRQRLAGRQVGPPGLALFEEHDLHGLASAVLGIGVSRQEEVQGKAAPFAGLDPGPARRVDAVGEDGGAAATRGKPHQRGAEVAERRQRIGVTADAARERRIDKQRGRPDRRG